MKKGLTAAAALENQYSKNTGKITLEKTFGGPVVDADLETLSFEVVNNTTQEKTILTLKQHFEKVPGPENKYKLKEDCELPLGSYTVTEKNYNDVTGADVSVSYKVGDGPQAVTGTGDAADFSLDTSDQKVKIAFTDDYTGTDVKISKMSLGGNEIEGATLTLSGKIGGENGPAFTFTEDNFTQKNYLMPGFTQGTAVTWISGTSAMEVKDLPNGVYTLHEVSAPNGYEAVTDITFVVNNGKVTVNNVEQTNNQIYMVDQYEEISVPVEATKSYQDDRGQDIALQGDEFTFALKNSSGRTIETVKNDASGKVTFTALGFDTTGDYTYTIEEVPGNEAGVTYDASVYTVKISVTEKANGVGGLEYTRTITKKTASGTASADTIAFSNTKTVDRSAKLTLTKTFGGPVVQEDFDTLSFEVSDGTTVIATFTMADFDLQNDGSYKLKTAKEPEVTVGKTYTVTEKNYDRSGAGVKVSYKIGNTGEDKASAEFTPADENPVVVDFNNEYPSTDVSISKKSLGGNEIAGAELTLTGKVGGENGPAVVFSAENFVLPGDAEGPANFTKGTEYTWKSGTSGTEVKNLPNGVYLLHEKAAPSGYVTVTDIQFVVSNGKVTVSGVEQTGNQITMTDDYKPVYLTFKAKKIYQDNHGSKLPQTAGQFSFELILDNLVIQTAQNDADGNVVFEPIEYGKDDVGTVKVYTIREATGNDADVDYDSTEYYVSVLVREKTNGVGGLEVFLRDQQKVSNEVSVNFTNVKTSPTAKLEIEKTFGGPVVSADLETLKFEIREKTSGNLVTTLTLKDDFAVQGDGTYRMKEECVLPVGQ